MGWYFVCGKFGLRTICSRCWLFPEGMENRLATNQKMEWWWKPQLSWVWQRFLDWLQLLFSSAPFRRPCWSQWTLEGKGTCVQTTPTENSKPSNSSPAITHPDSHMLLFKHSFMSNTPAMWTQIYGDRGECRYWNMVRTSHFFKSTVHL